MARKKTLSVILLLILSTLIFVQLSICTQTISKTEAPQELKQMKNPTFEYFTINQFNESAEPVTWFYLNLAVILLVPIIMIVYAIVDATRKKSDIPEKLEEEDKEETETRVESSNKFNPLIIRIGFFALFVQNVIMLPLLIAFIAMGVAINVAGPGGNPGLEHATMNLFKVFSILYYLDFVAALLCIIGLILFSLNIKEKILSYVASLFWLAWIGVGIYPRIDFVVSAEIFNPAPGGIDIIEYFLGFYGNTTFLLTCGYGCLALALFFTAKVLVSSGKLQRGGLLNAFGITNFSIGSFANILLLLLLTFGYQLTEAAISALIVVMAIFWIMKFLASPILGLVAGIITFNRIGKTQLS